MFTIGWRVLLAVFLDFKTGKSLDSSFFNFLDNEPKPVIPNFPSISGECYLFGIASQLPLPLVVAANLLNLSISLSHDMHFSCFLVNRASFSFYSSSDMTRMISLIFDSRKRRAFFTYNLSLFRNTISLSCRSLSSRANVYFS